MSKKTTLSFNLAKTAGRGSRPSVFDRIVKEIDASEIPIKYIEYVLVQYHDGSIVELSGSDLEYPISLNKDANWKILDESFRKMKDIKVFINIHRLERDINGAVSDLLDPYC